MSASWSQPQNPHPKFSVASNRYNMRLAALDWRYWSTRNKKRAAEWLDAAIDWRLTAARNQTQFKEAA